MPHVRVPPPKYISTNVTDHLLDKFQTGMRELFSSTYVKQFAKAEMPIYRNIATNWNNHPSTLYTRLLVETLDKISLQLIVLLTEQNTKDANDMSDENWKKKAVEYRLTDEDEPALKRFSESAKNNPADILRELIGEGYKISIVLSSSNDSICVTATGTERCRYNKDCFMSAWSDNLSEAVFMLGYKVFEVFESKTWHGKTKQANWG